MKRPPARLLVLLLVPATLLALPVCAFGDHLDYRAHFERDDVQIVEAEGGHAVRLARADLTLKPGEPELPAHLLRLAVPAGERVDSVQVLSARWISLPGRFAVRPVSEPCILSHERLGLPGPRRAERHREIYETDACYPREIVRLAGDGYLAGVHIADIVVHPVRYAPRSGKLELCEELELRVHTSPAPSGEAFGYLRTQAEPAARGLARRLVANAEALPGLGVRVPSASRCFPDDEGYDYLIITPEAFAASFRPLARWKMRKGLRVKTVTVEEIDAAHADLPAGPERIRQCVRDAYVNWGITYVLLGGDVSQVEERLAYAMSSGTANPTYDEIPADLYYSDLDGDWNANGVEPWGEIADGVDLYPDVFVGRLPALTVGQVSDMVDKILSYERAPPLDFPTRMLMTAEVLWWDPYTDSGESLDFLDETFVPIRFDPVEKLYESLGNEDKASVVGALNAGTGAWLHNGHGYYDLMSVGGGSLHGGDLGTLTNGSRAGLCYSIACLAAGFDYESCIAERWVRNPDGGGIAFIGNARFGWGSPGNPRFGYSDKLQQEFFRLLFQEGERELGRMLALVKAAYVPHSRAENVFRWHQYSVSLLGDPELSLWTDTPRTLGVTHPESVPLARSTFSVSVTDADVPQAGATVCVTDDAGLQRVGRTDWGGRVRLPLTPAAAGTLHVTVTAPDHLPYEGTCTAIPVGPFVSVAGVHLEDYEGGNGNGRLNAGESARIRVSLVNEGTVTAPVVSATLHSDDAALSVTDSTEAFGDLGPGSSGTGMDGFSVTLASSVPAEHVCLFTLEITTAAGGPWEETLAVPVAAPLLVLDRLAIEDGAGGNGNGRIDPGESFRLAAVFRNDGLDAATDVAVAMTAVAPGFSLVDSTGEIAVIDPEGSRAVVFAGEVTAGCPDPSFVSVCLDLLTAGGHAFAESTLLVVGTTGFADDVEEGAAHWTHDGTNDTWHVSTQRSHSGSAAWYCGRADTHRYVPATSSRLAGPLVRLAPAPRFSFWLWHELAMYGTDGLYVILEDAADADTLDFIASGGALGTLPIGSDWLEFSYDLSSFGFAAGAEVRPVFAFVSDGDSVVAEGTYLDDVVLTGTFPAAVTGVAANGAAFALRTEICACAPNPFQSETMVRFSLASPGPVRIAVHDVGGRLVSAVVVDDFLSAGRHVATWDGRTRGGEAAANGVYFLRLRAGREHHTAKLILLR